MTEYIVEVHDDHTEWYLDGKLHREDGPAIEYADGSKLWYQHGKLHRLDIKLRLELDIRRNKMKE